jgi:hypothetical protein
LACNRATEGQRPQEQLLETDATGRRRSDFDVRSPRPMLVLIRKLEKEGI